jgi:hypothetical protein
MVIRRVVAAALATTLAFGYVPAIAQQTNGVIGGTATDEADEPYADYLIQLRDVTTGQIVTTVPLNAQGLFTFENVGLGRRLLVELLHVKRNSIICSEGPYVLTASTLSKTDVNIDCGKTPAALLLLFIGGGTALATALARQSPSQ